MTEHEREEELAPEEHPEVVYGTGRWPLLTLRCLVGGIMMGLANLVPGVSGGTMLVAAGIYPRFVQAVAELSRLRFRRQSLFVLVVVGGCALVTIVLLAGVVRTATVDYRWMMYSLFIGLTLGGVPVVWGLARPVNGQVWAGFMVTFVVMIVLAQLSPSDAGSASGFGVFFVAGILGMSAMILPGISGSYLLVLLGAYLPVLDAIDQLKTAGLAGSPLDAKDAIVGVVLPVALGCLVAVLVVSNAIELALERFEKPTLGALLGFLVGSVFGLWPFEEFYRPEAGDAIRGVVLTAERIAELPPHKWPTRGFDPTFMQAVGSVLIAALGFLLTALLAKYFNKEPSEGAIDLEAD